MALRLHGAYFVVCQPPVLAVAAYGHYVRRVPTADHVEWLRSTVQTTVATAIHHDLTATWMWGDFNLRGVAPGAARPPPSQVPVTSHSPQN